MPEKKKKTEEKRPLDMTTDEAMQHLFGEEGAQKLKEIAHGTSPPPTGDGNGSKTGNKSARKHSSR